MEAPKRRSKAYAEQMKRLVEEYNNNGKRTVLLACDAFFPIVDGVVNVLDNYAKHIAETMNVLVLAPCFHGRVYGREYPVLGVKSAYSKKLFYQVALPQLDGRCRKILKNLRIDLIHTHSPFFVGRYVLNLHKKRNIPMIATFHSQYKQDFVKAVGDGALCRFLLRFILKVFNGSDEVWTMSTATGEVLKSYGYHGRAFRYIRNATTICPPEDYEGERRRGRERFALGDKTTFIFVGRLITQKNVLFLAEVLGELKRRGMEFKMLFVGDGPDRGALEKKLAAEGVFEDTLFTGHVSDPAELCELYAAADLFLFPSLYDAQSLVQIEAASRYTPTVFAENSVTSCTVKAGVNGYAFPLDVQAFASGVAAALADKEGFARCAENAYRDVYITWDRVIVRVADYYESRIEASAHKPKGEA